MEIKNKELFRNLLKNAVAKYVQQFPVFFYGNIIINIVLIVLFIADAFVVIMTMRFAPQVAVYGFLLLGVFMMIFNVTFRDMRRNFKILKTIREGHYDFEIEDFELDNVIEFLESLPKTKSEIKDMEIELSFDKLIEILKAAKIITCRKGVYDLGLKFKFVYEEKNGEI